MTSTKLTLQKSLFNIPQVNFPCFSEKTKKKKKRLKINLYFLVIGLMTALYIKKVVYIF